MMEIYFEEDHMDVEEDLDLLENEDLILHPDQDEDEYFDLNQHHLEPEEFVESLQQTIVWLHVPQKQAQIFALYSFFVYYRISQQIMRALLGMLKSSIFGFNIRLNVKEIFGKIQRDLQDANVGFAHFVFSHQSVSWSQISRFNSTPSKIHLYLFSTYLNL